jgi:hypothetical protein
MHAIRQPDGSSPSRSKVARSPAPADDRLSAPSSRRLGEEGHDQPRHQPGEDAPVGTEHGIAVVEIGQVGGSWVEVVAVARAAHARPAVAVRHDPQRRLTVEPFDLKHRAELGAPAALSFEHRAAEERERE